MNAAAEFLPESRLFDTHLEDLSDLELLALLLAPGNSPRKAFRQAQRVMEAAGRTADIPRLSVRQLQECGLSRRRATSLLAGEALFRRLRRTSLFPGQPFRSSGQIHKHFEPTMAELRKECFWITLLDGKNRILRLARISEGSLTASLAHPREVFRPAVREAAAGVIFVHNHPSGDPEPSQEDIQTTRRLVESGKIMGIRVLDHVIIGARRYFSFADQGML